jgi:hypothetical protein
LKIVVDIAKFGGVNQAFAESVVVRRCQSSLADGDMRAGSAPCGEPIEVTAENHLQHVVFDLKHSEKTEKFGS